MEDAGWPVRPWQCRELVDVQGPRVKCAFCERAGLILGRHLSAALGTDVSRLRCTFAGLLAQRQLSWPCLLNVTLTAFPVAGLRGCTDIPRAFSLSFSGRKLGVC